MPDTATSSAPPSTTPARPTDRASVRLAAFLVGVVLALIAGFGLGRATGAGPDATSGGAPAVGATDGHTHAPGVGAHDHSGAGGGTATTGGTVGGLAISDPAFRLAPESTTFVAGRQQPLRFQVLDSRRAPVTSFAEVHDKRLHLIVVRRDLTGYLHLHPTMAPDGTWSVPLNLPEAGVWRAYADFTGAASGGRQTPSTLGMDLTVTGEYRPRTLPAPARQAEVGGYTVSYEGRPQVGATQPLLFQVERGGGPAAVERYLGAYGHLVVLREGDLGYVHVHPEPELANGAVKFWLAAPSPGRYRMFLDFQVAGAVHTAQYTLAVG